jgi:AraC-like DNA-binding protein
MGATWRQLFGNFGRLGVSFEWHELPGDQEVDWGLSFHPESVELCLNLAGTGRIQVNGATTLLEAWTAAFYRPGGGISARRTGSSAHQFVTVEYSKDFLQRHLGTDRSGLNPVVRDLWRSPSMSAAVSPAEPLNHRQRELVSSLRQPPVLAAAQPVWFTAKAAELLGEFFFLPEPAEELFCHRHQRISRDRITQAVEILKRDLLNPPTLQQIAKQVGCSPFYLSRMFSKERGQTIPQFVRQLRLESAAELLRSGTHNVTEAAFAVGYSSLSHFSQAFHQQFGCCPGLYPMPLKNPQRSE